MSSSILVSQASNIILQRFLTPSPVTPLTLKGWFSGKPSPSRIDSIADSTSLPFSLSDFVATTIRGTPISYNAARTALSSALGTRLESTNSTPNASSRRLPKYFSAASSTLSFVSLLNFAYPKPGRSANPNIGLASPPPTPGTELLRLACPNKAYKFTDAVAPGVLPTRALSPPTLVTNLFNKLLLPTLDLPRKATSGTPNDGGSFFPRYAPTITRSDGTDCGLKRFQLSIARSEVDNKRLDPDISAFFWDSLLAVPVDGASIPNRIRSLRIFSASTFLFISV